MTIHQFLATQEDNTFIDPTYKIHPDVHIGKNVYIGPFCIIGYHAEKKGHETSGKVYISDNVIIHGLVTIDSGTFSDTYIGQGCYLMKKVHIGHDAVISIYVTISPGACIGGHAIIDKNVNIGMNATIHQKVIIPEGCIIGMSSTMPKGEYKPNRKYVKVARDIGPNANRHTDEQQ